MNFSIQRLLEGWNNYGGTAVWGWSQLSSCPGDFLSHEPIESKLPDDFIYRHYWLNGLIIDVTVWQLMTE
jgi:hypothetical protein